MISVFVNGSIFIYHYYITIYNTWLRYNVTMKFFSSLHGCISSHLFSHLKLNDQFLLKEECWTRWSLLVDKTTFLRTIEFTVCWFYVRIYHAIHFYVHNLKVQGPLVCLDKKNTKVAWLVSLYITANFVKESISLNFMQSESSFQYFEYFQSDFSRYWFKHMFCL